MPRTRTISNAALTCPLCGVGVPATAAACRGCHLPMADVRRHGASGTRGRRSRTRALGIRLVGVALYVGIVAWCVWQLPTALPFVAPAAAAGLVLHGVRARPWWALLAFTVIVVVLPFVLAPALGTGAFSDLADWIDAPAW